MLSERAGQVKPKPRARESQYPLPGRIPSPPQVTGRHAANFIAGPVSTTIMADFGADVIKVEPPTGDVYRVRGADYPPSPYNYPWIVDNRTKRSVAIDLALIGLRRQAD